MTPLGPNNELQHFDGPRPISNGMSPLKCPTNEHIKQNRTYAVGCSLRRERGLRPSCIGNTARKQTSEATKKCANCVSPKKLSREETEGDGTLKAGTQGGTIALAMIWETIRYAIVAALIIIPIRTFIAQPFVVSGNSMYPTFHNGEYLIVNELAKYQGTYERGDVVILRYPVEPSKYFIKRVIGLPQETVTIVNGEVAITGPTQTSPLILSEPYVKNPKQDDNFSRTLADGEYFVMGDNRAKSSDSRVWGPVPKDFMDGKVLLRLFPFTAINLHPGSLATFGIGAE